MKTDVPSPGTAVHELDTPTLTLDLAILEQNLVTMHSFFRSRSTRVRNVTKGHKCPAIAEKQMTTDGSVPHGLACAKVSEAEVMIAAGAKHIRMIEQVVGRQKIERLMGLAKKVHVIALADDPMHVDDLAQAASAGGLVLDVLVEVDIGLRRCGVLPGKPTVDLARYIAGKRGLRFAGLSGHEGTMAISDVRERTARTRERIQRLLNSREDVERNDLPVEICGAGSTTTWKIAGSMDGITEIDPGTYVLMDHRLAELMPDLEFGLALKIVATVISRPTADRAVIDAGHKALGMASDGGVPWVAHPKGATVNRLNSEHGILDLEGEAVDLRIGDKVHLIPRYHGTAVLANDRYVGVRDGRVECVWNIAARGSHQ